MTPAPDFDSFLGVFDEAVNTAQTEGVKRLLDDIENNGILSDTEGSASAHENEQGSGRHASSSEKVELRAGPFSDPFGAFDRYEPSESRLDVLDEIVFGDEHEMIDLCDARQSSDEDDLTKMTEQPDLCCNAFRGKWRCGKLILKNKRWAHVVHHSAIDGGKLGRFLCSTRGFDKNISQGGKNVFDARNDDFCKSWRSSCMSGDDHLRDVVLL
jgi:hypothetical protein